MCCLLEGRKKTRDLSGLTSLTSIEEPTYEHQPHIRPKTKCPQQQGVRLFDNCCNSMQYCLFYSICKLTRKLLLRVLASVVRACLAFLCWFFNASKRSEAAEVPSLFTAFKPATLLWTDCYSHNVRRRAKNEERRLSESSLFPEISYGKRLLSLRHLSSFSAVRRTLRFY